MLFESMPEKAAESRGRAAVPTPAPAGEKARPAAPARLPLENFRVHYRVAAPEAGGPVQRLKEVHGSTGAATGREMRVEDLTFEQLASLHCFFIRRNKYGIGTWDWNHRSYALAEGEEHLIRERYSVLKKDRGPVLYEHMLEEAKPGQSIVYPGLDSCAGITVRLADGRMLGAHFVIPYDEPGVALYRENALRLNKFLTDNRKGYPKVVIMARTEDDAANHEGYMRRYGFGRLVENAVIEAGEGETDAETVRPYDTGRIHTVEPEPELALTTLVPPPPSLAESGYVSPPAVTVNPVPAPARPALIPRTRSSATPESGGE